MTGQPTMPTELTSLPAAERFDTMFPFVVDRIAGMPAVWIRADAVRAQSSTGTVRLVGHHVAIGYARGTAGLRAKRVASR